MNRIKLLFVVSSSGFGGGENYVVEILKKIDKKKYFCGVCTPGNSIFYDVVSNYADKIYSIPFFDNADIYSFFKLMFIIKDYDVVHANLNRAVFFSGICGKILNIPVIATMHGIDKRFYYRFVKDIIFLSRYQMRFFKKYFSNSQKKLINIGIESDINVTDNVNRADIRKRLGIPDNAKIIGTVARLHKLKGIDILVKAFSILCSKRDDIYNIIIGDGPERKRLEILCNTLGVENKVIFTGSLKDPWEEFGFIIDIFVLPSLKENIPVSILEAMARNIPVIASNAGGICEEIPESCIVKEDCPEKYSLKILEILENNEKIKDITNKNFLRLKKRFNIDTMVKKLEMFYEQKYNL